MIHEKDGAVFCQAFLVWAKKRQCKACLEAAALTGARVPYGADAHHFPPKGMGGARRRDDRVIPLCPDHHALAQAYVIPRAKQERWVTETRSEFLEECTVDELHALVDALEVWKDRPMEIPF